MRSHPFHHPLTVVLLAVGFSSVRAQIPEGFEVVQLANDLGIHSRPEINNNSEVVWSSSFPPDVSDVWVFSNGVTAKISEPQSYDVWPAINDSGLIPWMRCTGFSDSGCDLVAYDDGTVESISTPVSIDQPPAVSNDGVIVWARDFSGTLIPS